MKKLRNEPWGDFADDVIRRYYPSGGADACMPLLPARSRSAIQQRAWRLGASDSGESECPIPYQDDPHIHRLWMACDVAMGGDRRLAA